MPRAHHETINVSNVGIDDNQYPPPSAQNQALQGVSNFVDGSGPIFSMCMEMATEEDKKMAENWKADADGILIFTGLFSAAVATLISVSIQDIRPNPQDTSNFYLANIYQTVSALNQSDISLPSSPPPFSPPTYAVWVNSLWFMSLVISLTCALLATLLQQWARRYLRLTQSRYSPHKRARIRAFFAEGVEKLLLPWTVETLPALLHISLFLFFAGLVVFLCNVNITTFKLVLSWVGVCTTLYGCITSMPLFRHDSPYYTSLSSSVWLIVFGIAYVGSQLRSWFYLSIHYRRPVFRRMWSRYRKLVLQGMQRAAEETALNSGSEIDTRAFMWTFDCLDEDHELERFFSGLPGFRNSRVVNDPLPSLNWDQKKKLSTALVGLFDRTFSSNLLPESVKIQRAIICAKALDPAKFPICQRIIGSILFDDRCRGLQTVEFGHTVRGWGNSGDKGTASVALAIVTGLVARVQRHDDSWFVLASDALSVPESVLRNYATNGDSLSLAILTHTTRQQLFHYQKSYWPKDGFSEVLDTASNFNVQDTSPELQHEFCALWNQIVLKAQNDNDWGTVSSILRRIRSVYIALHQDIDSAPTLFSVSTTDNNQVLLWPSSYPVCNVAGHIHDVSASTSFVRTVLHDSTVLVPGPLSSSNAPTSSIPAPLHVVESLTDVPSLSNFHPAHQATIETFNISVTSPDPATASAIRDIVTSGITTPHPTLETSASAPPLSSTSPPAMTALGESHSPRELAILDLPPEIPSLRA